MNGLSRKEIEQHLENTLRIKTSCLRKHAKEYKNQGKVFYLKAGNRFPIVIHPDWCDRLLNDPLDDVRPEPEFYKNTNLGEFPALGSDRTSKSGCDVEIRDVAALEALLVRIGAIQSPETDETTAFADIETAAPQLATLSKTEREAVTVGRIGQDLFRAALMSAWSNQCAVTGIDVEDLLRASHIKPWRDSDDEDRLDAENGILLVATLDAAFDAGLISFADDGLMLFSPGLGSDPCTVLSVPAGCRLTRGPSRRQQDLLRHHRDHVFPHGPLRGV